MTATFNTDESLLFTLTLALGQLALFLLALLVVVALVVLLLALIAWASAHAIALTRDVRQTWGEWHSTRRP